jgi:predicted SprT family Zn-dependent metalloprotease
MSPIRQALAKFKLKDETEHARGVIQLTFDQLGYSHLDKITRLEWNNRFVNRAGDATVTATKTKDLIGKIRLGIKYFAIADENNKLETLVHEACHIVDQYKWHIEGGNRKFDGHGQIWKDLMRQVGYPDASPFHCVNTSAFKSYYVFNCPRCGSSGRLTAQMGGRIINGTSSRICRNCKLLIMPFYLKKI